MDYYTSLSECKLNLYNNNLSNPRYKNFKQTHYTVGDVQQFISVLYSRKQDRCNTKAIFNTFLYLFNNYKKCIYIRIRNGKIVIFQPFSNSNYYNNYLYKLKPNTSTVKFIRAKYPIETTKYNDLNALLWYCQYRENRKFNLKYINAFPEKWYLNNGLCRYEYPVHEGDSGVHQISDMFKELCKMRKINDVDFFVNRRDFPLWKIDNTYAYDNIARNNKSITSDDMIPILSMTKHCKFRDIVIPTWEDWARCRSLSDNVFFRKTCTDYNIQFELDWDKKRNIAIFRGSSTPSLT